MTISGFLGCGFIAAYPPLSTRGTTGGLLAAGLALLMLASAIVDYRYLIIPNELAAAALALINAGTADAPSIVGSIAATAPRGTITLSFF